MKIEIPLNPMASPRPRFSKWGTYMPAKYQDFKKLLQQHYPTFRFNSGVPIRLDTTFYIQMPKSWSNKKKNQYRGKYHIQKPDRDNLDKTILDSMTDYFFDDDCQICSGLIQKFWADEGKIVIEITEAIQE